MKINFSAPFCSTSYGLVALNTIKALTEMGHEVSAFPIGGMSGEDIPNQFHQSLQQSLDNAKFWDVNAPSVRLFHQFSLAEFPGKYRVAWPIFELDKFNEVELHHLKSADQILVCSDWGKQICIENGLTQKIDVVPLGVDRSIFHWSEKVERKIPGFTASFVPDMVREVVDDQTCTFLSVSKKEIRKCHDVLRTYFEKAFTAYDNVSLRMCWGNRILNQIKPKESREWTQYYNSSPLKDKIRLFEWQNSQQDIANQMNMADCFIGLSRAEGFNLNLLEALACGLPVISNFYSAHTEFLTEQNAMLVPFREKEVAIDNTWFFGQGEWMAFGKDEEERAVEYMREIYRRKQLGEDLLNLEGIKTANKFTWENTANKLLKALNGE